MRNGDWQPVQHLILHRLWRACLAGLLRAWTDISTSGGCFVLDKPPGAGTICGCQMSDNLAIAPQPGLASQAVAVLLRGIQHSRWRVGERLPAEPALAADLGISRPTLR